MRRPLVPTTALILALSLACGGTPSEDPALPKLLEARVPRDLRVVEGPFTQVSMGNTDCALGADGAAHCWRDLDGAASRALESVELSGSWTELAAGSPLIGGVRSDGALVGQGGHGLVEEPGPFTAASFGDGAACGLRASGAIYCLRGEGDQAPPVPKGEGFTSLAVDGRGGCALDARGHSLCWGQWEGRVPADRVLTQISVGERSLCGLDPSGSVHCWGELAEPGAGPMQAVDLSRSGTSACALREGGEIACWGPGFRYTKAAERGRFQALSVGTFRVCGLRTDGALECWPVN